MSDSHPTRRLVITSVLATVASLAAPALGRSAAPTMWIGGSAFGTVWRMTLPSGTKAERLRPLVEVAIAKVDARMSPWRRDSAIARFNRAQSTDWLQVDGDTAAVASAALRLRAESGGAFDPTVGPIVGRWGFGPISASMPPSGSTLSIRDNALCKAHPALTLDLCGIAKGFAVDRIADALRQHGAQDFVIALGGEIFAHGEHPSGREWHVAVEDPRQGHDGAAEVLTLRGRAIATSGDKINGYYIGERRFSHIIDPATASPVLGAASSVSVIAGDAMSADGWATALMAAGVDGPELARRNALDALFLFGDGDELRRLATGRFDAHLA